MAQRNSGPGGIVSMVCITCGNERSFTRQVPMTLTCDKCGGTVFREFDTPTVPDEATLDQLDAQAPTSSDGDGPAGPSAEALAAVGDAEAYFGFGMTRPLFMAAGELRWIQSAA